jgi:hypothetical protein
MSDTRNTTPVEFRLRFYLFGLIYLLGFAVPWDWALHLDGSGPNAHTWGRLAVELTKTGSIAIDGAFNVVLAVATALAFAGAWLRTWGSAYLDSGAVLHPLLRSEALTADGPYRYVRNPLYLGTMFLTLALAVLMPASGAVFAILAIALLLGRLIFLEERFLAQGLGGPYAEYCARVGRMVPGLLPRIDARGERPHWLQAFLGEIFAWGVAGSFAAAGWRYNAGLLTQCVLVSLGVWLIVRAFPLRQPAEQPRG